MYIPYLDTQILKCHQMLWERVGIYSTTGNQEEKQSPFLLHISKSHCFFVTLQILQPQEGMSEKDWMAFGEEGICLKRAPLFVC